MGKWAIQGENEDIQGRNEEIPGENEEMPGKIRTFWETMRKTGSEGKYCVRRYVIRSCWA